MLAGLLSDKTSSEAAEQPPVTVTASTAYSKLYSDVFRTFSEIAGSTTLLRQHLSICTDSASE